MLVIVCDDLLCFFVQYVPLYIGGLWLLYIFRFHRFLFFAFFMHAFFRCSVSFELPSLACLPDLATASLFLLLAPKVSY